MPDLRMQTVKSALFVVRESMAALRQHVANLDHPASVDRVIREAEIMSTSLKKLHAYLGDEPKNDMPASAGPTIELRVVSDFFEAAQDNRICAHCGGIQRQ